jgi:hypothetical protein
MPTPWSPAVAETPRRAVVRDQTRKEFFEMKRIILAVTVLAIAGSAMAQQSHLMGYFNFNNSPKNDRGEGHWVGPDHYHAAVPDGTYEDGLWTGPSDDFIEPGSRGDLLLPYYDTYSLPANVDCGVMVGDNDGVGADSPLGQFNNLSENLTSSQTLVGHSDYVGAAQEPRLAIDVSDLVGDNDGTYGFSEGAGDWGSFYGTSSTPALTPDTNIYEGGSLAVIGQGNNGRGIVIEVDGDHGAAAGKTWGDFQVEYYTRGTSTGFTTHTWSWSADGENFTDVGVLLADTTGNYGEKSVDFSGIEALNQADRAYLKLTFAGATSDVGNNRIDNLVVSANEVPEPASLSVLGLGAMALVRRRRRK